MRPPEERIVNDFFTSVHRIATCGALGIALGVLGSGAVSVFGKWPMVIPPESIVLAFVFAALTGVFFGYYPASKAAHLNPIDALRFE